MLTTTLGSAEPIVGRYESSVLVEVAPGLLERSWRGRPLAAGLMAALG